MPRPPGCEPRSPGSEPTPRCRTWRRCCRQLRCMAASCGGRPRAAAAAAVEGPALLSIGGPAGGAEAPPLPGFAQHVPPFYWPRGARARPKRRPLSFSLLSWPPLPCPLQSNSGRERSELPWWLRLSRLLASLLPSSPPLGTIAGACQRKSNLAHEPDRLEFFPVAHAPQLRLASQALAARIAARPPRASMNPVLPPAVAPSSNDEPSVSYSVQAGVLKGEVRGSCLASQGPSMTCLGSRGGAPYKGGAPAEQRGPRRGWSQSSWPGSAGLLAAVQGGMGCTQHAPACSHTALGCREQRVQGGRRAAASVAGAPGGRPQPTGTADMYACPALKRNTPRSSRPPRCRRMWWSRTSAGSGRARTSASCRWSWPACRRCQSW